NPVNWHQLGDFFKKTDRLLPKRAPASDHAPWRGVLYEEFVVDWNHINSYVFRQKLKVDYTVDPDLVRADYSLMYEQDEQIQLNEGFFEARQIAGSRGWVHAKMSKTVRFNSSILNLLAPAILAMFLDNKTEGFKHLLQSRVGGK